MRIVLQGGTVVDGDGERSADVVVDNGMITEVRLESRGSADAAKSADSAVIDCRGRFVMPGFVDAHSHADGLLGDTDVQRALLKQGVTTVIAGQDGVSYAPGDGAYAGEYFAAINGPHATYAGGGVAEYLAAVDGASRLNAAYLVPAGTVRHQACGRSNAPADTGELDAMTALVETGMREGAVGLSTGLDYVPGIFAPSSEIAALCTPVAVAGGVYVSHMRGGYEANSETGISEIAAIAQAAGVRAHVSHFHADPDVVLAGMSALERAGVDATFDAYPYVRGCTLLAMPLLPPDLSSQPVDAVVDTISDPRQRAALRRDWFPAVERNASLGPEWPAMITFAHIAAPRFAWACGLTVEAAASRAGTDAIDFALDVLAASRLEVNAVMAVRHDRSADDLARIVAHPRHMGGSDGIFIGDHPHPRARGTFARYLREFVRERPTWTWPQAADHLAAAPAERFGLGRRGRVRPGWVADLIVVAPESVGDTATYDAPLGEAVGIDDVLVAGVPVLQAGELTPGLPGAGLRRDDIRASKSHGSKPHVSKAGD